MRDAAFLGFSVAAALRETTGRLRPDFAEAYNNLGIVLAQQGKLNEAITSYQQALQLKTDYAEAVSNLGLALADYPGFRQEGFEISALFDTLSTKVGQRSRGGVPIHEIQDLKKIVRRDGISIAVIAVPAPSAQHVVNLVVAAGIKAVLNFSPGTLQVPPDVKLKSVDLTVSLESLSFFLAQGEEADIGRERP